MCASALPDENAVRVVVLLGLGADTRVPPVCDPRSGRVREEWLVREIDRDSGRALELALRLKVQGWATSVTVVHFGPESTVPWLRRTLAQGADRAVRVWDGEAAGARAPGKAVILAAAAEAAGFDLVLAGARGAVDACGQVGVLVSARLGVPCVTQVVDVTVGTAEGPRFHRDRLEMVRGLDRGFRERVEAVLPAVATVSADQGFVGPSASLTPAGSQGVTAKSLIAAQAHDIPVWDLADLGVPLQRVRDADGRLVYGRPRPPRPRLRPIAAPDSALPAFDRILRLIQGSVRRREGRMVRLPPDETVDVIFRTLRDEGWLDHLRPFSGEPQ